MTSIIQTQKLTKSYGSHRGIIDIDLEIAEGEVFGFLGPNGAGKTTLIRVLLDFLRPSAGMARVLGLQSRRDSVAIHRRIGYVPGDPTLYERITGAELLEWLSRLRGNVEPKERADLVERFGVETDRPIRELSKGNRQKVALVQAFMHRPELLILDEPTAGLDPLVQHEFQQLVHEVAAEGRTVFLSSHRLDEVQHLCEHVGIIRDGELVAVEDVEALRERATREVIVTFAEPVDATPFAALPGVRDVDVEHTTMHLHLTGSADDFVKLLARHEVLDLTSAAPDLKDLFLQYYEGEEGGDGAPRR
jgi:ABC-2 type transport system ATP-binding protein